MKNLKSLFSITDNCMNRLDIRVKQHLINVGYLSLEYARRNNFDKKTTESLVIAGYLHDIGIVTTGKVDNLLCSEEHTLVEHSVLGSMYLKYHPSEVSPDIILYHHIPYDDIPNIKEEDKYLANIINLIDRIDFIITASLSQDTIEDSIKYIEKRMERIKTQYSNKIFNESKVLLDEYIIRKFRSGEHIDVFSEYLELTETSDEIYYGYLSSLVYIIDSQSVLTAGHSHITAEISKILAEMLGMNDEKQNVLYYAGILHDIGKIAVPAAILKKPTSLTKEEFDEIKKHSLYTVEILKDNIPEAIYYPAIRHHENLMGTGYPYGFKELTIEDEVVRMSDLIAALAENRYYRESLPIETVVEILTDDYKNGNCSKRIFDCIMENIYVLYESVTKKQRNRRDRYQELIDVYIEGANELNKIDFYYKLIK